MYNTRGRGQHSVLGLKKAKYPGAHTKRFKPGVAQLVALALGESARATPQLHIRV